VATPASQGRWHKNSLKGKALCRPNFMHGAQLSMDILIKEAFRSKNIHRIHKLKREQN